MIEPVTLWVQGATPHRLTGIGCGRALASTGAITMIGDTVNAGDCNSAAAAGSSGLSGGLHVDEVSGLPEALDFSPVSTVPEPESYAMPLAGLGLIGAVVKRRKATQE